MTVGWRNPQQQLEHSFFHAVQGHTTGHLHSLCPLPSPASLLKGGGYLRSRDSKSSLHTQTGKGPPPPASLQGLSSLGRILCCHGDQGPPRAWLIVSEFTQAWSTIRQDGFLNRDIRRPGCPEKHMAVSQGKVEPRRGTL